MAPFFHGYISQGPETDLMEAFPIHTEKFFSVISAIPEEKHDYAYAPGKWTIREVVQHIIDTERVFNYRTLCFARNSPTPLPGFDENLFAANSKAAKRNWNDLLEEFRALRTSSRLMYAAFDEDQLDGSGTANNNPAYVLGMGYTTLGHVTHHLNILEERY